MANEKEVFNGWTYIEYLHSDLWKAKRAQAIRDANYKCRICQSMFNLEVHHLSYAHLGNELPEELIVVCEKCHEEVHCE